MAQALGDQSLVGKKSDAEKFGSRGIGLLESVSSLARFDWVWPPVLVRVIEFITETLFRVLADWVRGSHPGRAWATVPLTYSQEVQCPSKS